MVTIESANTLSMDAAGSPEGSALGNSKRMRFARNRLSSMQRIQEIAQGGHAQFSPTQSFPRRREPSDLRRTPNADRFSRSRTRVMSSRITAPCEYSQGSQTPQRFAFFIASITAIVSTLTVVTLASTNRTLRIFAMWRCNALPRSPAWQMLHCKTLPLMQLSGVTRIARWFLDRARRMIGLRRIGRGRLARVGVADARLSRIAYWWWLCYRGRLAVRFGDVLDVGHLMHLGFSSLSNWVSPQQGISAVVIKKQIDAEPFVPLVALDRNWIIRFIHTLVCALDH